MPLFSLDVPVSSRQTHVAIPTMHLYRLLHIIKHLPLFWSRLWSYLYVTLCFFSWGYFSQLCNPKWMIRHRLHSLCYLIEFDRMPLCRPQFLHILYQLCRNPHTCRLSHCTSCSPTPPASPSHLLPPVPNIQQRVHHMQTRNQNNIYKPKRFFAATKHPLPPYIEPTTVKQVLNSPHWRAAMHEEFITLQRFDTWDLVQPPPNVNIIECKWLFYVNQKPDGSIDKYKAWLVAKGFNQCPGVNFWETFSHVKSTTIWTILSLALHYNWPLHQLDVRNAFLHGSLDVPVYMSQPPGFKDNESPSHVCLLRRTL